MLQAFSTTTEGSGLPPSSSGRLRAALMVLNTVGANMTIGAAISFLTVATFENHSAREYGEMLGLSSSTMSRHLLDLGEMNRKREPGMMLIEQRPDPMDRRRSLYRLTPKGRGLITAILQVLEQP